MSHPWRGPQGCLCGLPSIFWPLARLFSLSARKSDFSRTCPLFPGCFQLPPSVPPTFPGSVQGFSYFSKAFPSFPRLFLVFQGFSYFRKTLGKVRKTLGKWGKPWRNPGKAVQNLGGSRKHTQKNREVPGNPELPWKQLEIPGQGPKSAGGPQRNPVETHPKCFQGDTSGHLGVNLMMQAGCRQRDPCFKH